MLASSREPCRHREALRGVEDAAPYKLQGKHCRESPGDVTGPAIMRRGGIHPARGTLPCREPLRASNARPYDRWEKRGGPPNARPVANRADMESAPAWHAVCVAVQGFALAL